MPTKGAKSSGKKTGSRRREEHKESREKRSASQAEGVTRRDPQAQERERGMPEAGFEEEEE